jgi:hypothetical protein
MKLSVSTVPFVLGRPSTTRKDYAQKNVTTVIYSYLIKSFHPLSRSKLTRAVMLLTFFVKVPRLNAGRDAGYADWDISWLFSVPPGTSRKRC